MSNLTDKEARLCDTIRTQFQNQGVFDDIKCQIQSRLVNMMRGGGESAQLKAKNTEQDARTQLLNQLIMEYLHWHEYNYSAEMFAMETGIVKSNPNRELLEAALGVFQMKEIPILLEIVLGLWHKERGAGDTDNL